MMLNDSYITVNSVLDSFFLLKPEWQMPLFACIVFLLIGVIDFAAKHFIEWSDKRHRREFMKEYYNEMRAKQRAENEQQLQDEAESFYEHVYPC